MIRFGIPILAVGLLGYALLYVTRTRQEWPQDEPWAPPPQSTYRATVAGAGMIEAETENIAVGTPVSGIVVEVFVQVGEQVDAGSPLFRIDDRPARAELAVREAALQSARAELERAQGLPRAEDLPVLEAALRQREATKAQREFDLRRVRKLAEEGSAAPDELVETENLYREAEALFDQARSELERLRAGAWEHDLVVLRAAVAQAEAQVETARTELERLTVRALSSGQVLQVNVRPGEFVGATPGQALVLFGSLRALHVRVDIDEFDIARFDPQAPAQASRKGDAESVYPLRFVRVEPYVVPKRSLTGENIERVDTRVMQVIYAVDAPPGALYVGQQVDVFIDASGGLEPKAVPDSGGIELTADRVVPASG